jgi:Icc-related predicted phosphoesterase
LIGWELQKDMIFGARFQINGEKSTHYILRNMKICGISDMHGNYDFVVEPCDIVLICGDIVPLDIQHDDTRSEMWFKTFFIPWCTNLPCEKAVFIGGNHDFCLMRNPTAVRDMLKEQDKVIYLDCESYEYKGKVIFGTPWCKPFFRWAFMESYEDQDKRYARYLKTLDDVNIDIVLSHDAPYGVSDVLLQEDCPWADGKSHIGNESLKKFIESAKPGWNFHGHLHSTNHEKELLGDTKVYNVSLLDENYIMAYEPLYFEIE